MKRMIILSAFLIVAALPASTMAAPTEFTYSPTPADMYDLDHNKYYKWRIDLTSAGYTIGTPITEATLTFDNINNWDRYANVMYVHLLNTASGSGLTSGDDGQVGGDKYAGQGVLIDSWHDAYGDPGPAEDLVYTFSDLPDHRNILSDLNIYASDGYIAFGIDPDCHYWNDGVKFTIYTTAIPAPGAVLLGSIGVSIVGWMRRRRTL